MLAVEKHGFTVGTCKLCGQPVLWAHNLTGKGRIPLDPKAPTFKVVQRLTNEARQTELLNSEATLVSHFSTCPAKTKAWDLLQRMAVLFKDAGAGVYPSCEGAERLLTEVQLYLHVQQT